ncbi:hypothetical protein MNV_690012 [Candidatus Methanoperedens nitroreducens]|uniref:Uncharacterized protein n=1 Tax=Candidatus Methanoperedens nitratireducens TaxID=1392998 RepID=A0A284VT04_9EURY|nr:hypothetical protein MNV_690012 [Candidatus Methanoperedens nitroreducens]
MWYIPPALKAPTGCVRDLYNQRALLPQYQADGGEKGNADIPRKN